MYGRSYMGIERSAFLVDEHGALAQVWYKVSPAATAPNLLTGAGPSECRGSASPARPGRAPGSRCGRRNRKSWTALGQVASPVACR